jgi:hypothetical protein
MTDFKNCQNCGKPTKNNLQFCNKKCATLFYTEPIGQPKPLEANQQEKDGFITQFEKGNGMDRRVHNIHEIIKLKKQGKSDDDIINIAGLYLRDVTIREYLKIAKYHIEHGDVS